MTPDEIQRIIKQENKFEDDDFFQDCFLAVLEQKAETALASVWAIELQQDNMEVCKSRVRALFAEYGYNDLDFEKVFKTNFIVDDALKIMRKWQIQNEIDDFSLK